MFCQSTTESELAGAIIPAGEFAPFPRCQDRDAWRVILQDDLQRQRADVVISQAESAMGQPWPQLPATLYAEFVRIGNRTHYEAPYFERRNRLGTLVLAECYEAKGRFLDEILNGIVAILEELSWALPAHAFRHQGDILPCEDRHTVALFSCETAAVLAETHYLLGAELQALSPTIYQRIPQQIQARILEPVEENIDRYVWADGHNNWTPWCVSNIFLAASYVMTDRQRLATLIHSLLMPVLDRFLNRYPVDGCCDEGPGYWNASPGALVVFLEQLHAVTNGAFSWYDDPLIQKMGRYVVDAHLAGNWALNFADAQARFGVRRAVTYRYGERIGCPEMMDLVLHFMRRWQPDGEVDPPIGSKGTGDFLCQAMREITWMPTTPPQADMKRQRCVWYPHTEVLIAREKQVPDQGLILAAKGGHNGENHNHNDVGQFVVLCDGKPMIVDVGVGCYSAKTFSSTRYELPFMRSSGHNIPVINGIEQSPGHDFRASDVSLTQEGETVRLTLDLSTAYENRAGLQSLVRTMTLASDGITIADSYGTESPVEIVLNLYTPADAVKVPEGLLLRSDDTALLLSCSDFLSMTLDSVPMEDRSFKAAWGDMLTRISLKGTVNPGTPCQLTFTRPG